MKLKIEKQNHDALTRIVFAPFSIFNFQFSIQRNASSANGGEGGIRTLDTREGITVFETAAFNRSATSPFDRAGAAGGKTPGAKSATPLP